MDPQIGPLSHERELLESLSIHTVHNLHPPPSSVRLSQHITDFVKNVLKDDSDDLLIKPTIRPPPVMSDLPFTDYFVSTSHNTYLLSKQILGKSSPASYTHVLSHGARCVEIDVWPSSKGPIVTHGHTFSQSVPFAEVCAAIGAAVVDDCWPVLVSLECHVYGEEKQEELVRIMKQAWGSKFIDRKLDGDEDKITPEIVMGRILVMVEYYPPPIPSLNEGHEESEVPPNSSSSSSSSSSESEGNESSLWPRKKIPSHLRISQVLADVGYYLQSMKPTKNWFTKLFSDPPNIMLNISESSFLSLLTQPKPILNLLITHSQSYIRRIYPKGLRLTSSNLRPYLFWGTGSHVVALNWQTYDHGMQVNEAMFVGTPGWVPKPAWMRDPTLGADPHRGEKKLMIRGEVIGVCSTPPPSDRERKPDSKPYNAYVKAELFLPTASAVPPSSLNLLKIQTKNELEYRSESQSVSPSTGDLNFAYPDDEDDVGSSSQEWDKEWNNLRWGKKRDERGLTSALFEWEIFEKWEELTFLRSVFSSSSSLPMTYYILYSNLTDRLSVCEKEFGKDDTLAIFCARVADIRRSLIDEGTHPSGSSGSSGWRMVRLFDSHGKASGAIALVRFRFALTD
ncbi:hypothetical protein NP233_g4205 [Leucocoprinus birnbaumii]|uniref:Phosphoinositide phospholipase C n=1 Tax=Leucocoprinus birnbaumii TaxID=56174 RepID=A0AAD5VV33_9AGAR|nr:hypothetical protein NP233_g4205 [Leucocoprinus birnbaumii]